MARSAKTKNTSSAAFTNKNTTPPTKTDTKSEPMHCIIERNITKICEKHDIQYKAILIKKFLVIYENHITKLSHCDENTIKIYTCAFVYNYIKSKAPPKDFADGIKIKIFSAAIKKMNEWLKQNKEENKEKEIEMDYVCNLYTMRE